MQSDESNVLVFFIIEIIISDLNQISKQILRNHLRASLSNNTDHSLTMTIQLKSCESRYTHSICTQLTWFVWLCLLSICPSFFHSFVHQFLFSIYLSQFILYIYTYTNINTHTQRLLMIIFVEKWVDHKPKTPNSEIVNLPSLFANTHNDVSQSKRYRVCAFRFRRKNNKRRNINSPRIKCFSFSGCYSLPVDQWRLTVSLSKLNQSLLVFIYKFNLH